MLERNIHHEKIVLDIPTTPFKGDSISQGVVRAMRWSRLMSELKVALFGIEAREVVTDILFAQVEHIIGHTYCM